MKLHSNYLASGENKEETLRNAEWTAAMSPQNIWRKYVSKKTEKGEKQGSKTRCCLYSVRLHNSAGDLFINTGLWWNAHPSLSFSESIIYLNKQQTLQGHKCKSITKESELQNGEAVTLWKPRQSRKQTLAIVTVDKTMRTVKKCTVLLCACVSVHFHCFRASVVSQDVPWNVPFV